MFGSLRMCRSARYRYMGSSNLKKNIQIHYLTGSQLSACSLIKLLFSNLLLILSVNNPAHMYLSDLRVYFKVEVYFRVTESRMEEY